MVPTPYYDEERRTRVSVGDGYGAVYTVKMQLVHRPQTSIPTLRFSAGAPAAEDDKAESAAARKAKPAPYWVRFQKPDKRGRQHDPRRR